MKMYNVYQKNYKMFIMCIKNINQAYEKYLYIYKKMLN